MLCAIPFWSGDVESVRILLNWINRLGGCRNHETVLVADAGVGWHDVMDLVNLAEDSFSSVEVIAADDSQIGWPQGPNWLFRTAAKYAKERGESFFLLEPDAVPLKPGWLDQLEIEYAASGKPFMGALLDCEQPGLPSRYLAGVACYPSNAIDIIGPALDERPHIAWDISSAEAIMPQAANSPHIQHFWGNHRQSPVFVSHRAHNGPANLMTQGDIWKDALVFHRNKDGSLIRMLGGEAPYIVAHGGDVGDLIYGLPAMKVLGQCRLVVHWHPVREGFNAQKFAKIYPLLAIQPYLHSVVFQHECPETPWNFNRFRPWNWERRATRIESLAQSQLRIFNLPEAVLQEQWLCVDEPVFSENKKVVFHRSFRYRNRNFPWKEILAKYGRYAVFVGMPDEHQNFCAEIGPVDYFPTEDYLELARVIAGAVLFVGNQSCPYAIAEGLKQNAILETCPGCEDCQFYRPNLQNDPQGRIHLYNLEDLERIANLNRAA